MEENKLVKVSNRKYYLLALLILVLIIIDQVTKFLIIKDGVKFKELVPDLLNLEYVENTGGAFGVAQGNIGTFIISNIVVLGIIIRFMFIQKDRIDLKTNIMLCFVLSGGISNLIDRIFRGFVVDFIEIIPIINFPKFNFADVYIVLGWVFLALFFAMYTIKEIKAKENRKIKKGR